MAFDVGSHLLKWHSKRCSFAHPRSRWSDAKAKTWKVVLAFAAAYGRSVVPRRFEPLLNLTPLLFRSTKLSFLDNPINGWSGMQAMSPSPPVANKRARGSYAKFICFNCRERRIKCALPENVTIHPSSEPQPPTTSCRRCQQQGLDCIVRKTTLGRPNQKRQRSSTPPTTGQLDANVSSRSPSPAVEDFVLLNLDKEAETKTSPDILTPSSTATNIVPTSTQLMEAIGKTFDMTSTLMARDRRFGRLGMGLQDVVPSPIQDVVSQNVATMLDQ